MTKQQAIQVGLELNHSTGAPRSSDCAPRIRSFISMTHNNQVPATLTVYILHAMVTLQPNLCLFTSSCHSVDGMQLRR